jgi:ubiquinone/menaquinone biosynthesis C-methylase UbiE
MDRRIDAVELLDGPLDDPAALVGNLRDLRRINRWLGGVRLSADAIDALAAHREQLTVLDVGTGGADIPVALLARADKRGRGLAVVGIDSRPEVLAAAVVAQPAVARTAGLELHVGDGRSLPYGDGSFDVAHTSMVVHHLAPQDAILLLL